MNVWVKAKFTFMHMLQANKKSKRTINTQRERERGERVVKKYVSVDGVI